MSLKGKRAISTNTLHRLAGDIETAISLLTQQNGHGGCNTQAVRKLLDVYDCLRGQLSSGSSDDEKDDQKDAIQKQQMVLELVIKVLESWAEAQGLSLISSQQLHSPSAERNEHVRMLFQEIGKFR